MPLLEIQDVRDNLLEADEIPGAIKWAKFHKLRFKWYPKKLIFKLWLTGDNGEKYLLQGSFEDYKVLPPTWLFLDPRTEQNIGKPAYPAPGSFHKGSVLHTNGVICAPWSRMAYGDRSGPHSEWEDPSAWQKIGAEEQTRATIIPDMLARIHVEVKLSPNRLAELPQLLSKLEEGDKNELVV